MPAGTPVVFAGGRLQFATNEDAKAFAQNVWSTLDKVRDHVADMVLVHGGDSKGADRLAGSWAESRKIPQIAFGLDVRLGQRAGFKRNEQMLSLKPRYVVDFRAMEFSSALSSRRRGAGSPLSIGADPWASVQSLQPDWLHDPRQAGIFTGPGFSRRHRSRCVDLGAGDHARRLRTWGGSPASSA